MQPAHGKSDGLLGSLTINWTAVVIQADGSFSALLTLTEGANSLTIAATDTSGNSTSDSRGITLDSTASALDIDLPADNSTTATAADLAGNPSRATRNIAYQPYPNGDLNDNQNIDVVDALLALRIAVGLVPLQPGNLAAGDVAPFVNGHPQPDGKLNAADALILLRRAVGLISW